MLKFSNKKLLAIALLFSFMTSLLVYYYLQKASDKTTKASVSVVVAKADLMPKTKITPEMVEIANVPAEYVQPGAVMDLKSVIGVIVREHMVPGEQITERRLVREGRAVGFTGIIPRDKRAVTVAVNEVSGVAGFIKPGDYVDVIVTFEQALAGDNVSHIMLQNIMVLATNRDADNGVTANSGKDGAKEVVKTATVTLAVTPDEAAKLTLAHEKGKVNLALRPYLPLNGIEITNVITPKDLVGIQASPVSNSKQNYPDNSRPVSQPVFITQSGPAQSSAPNPPAANGISVIRGTKVVTVPVD